MRLEIYKPVKPWLVHNHFGDGVEFYKSLNIGFNNGHNGADVAVPMWTPVYSPIDGTIYRVETDEKLGLGVGIVSDKKWEFEQGEYYVKIRLWHFAANNVTVGQKVGVGQLVGWADNTGVSTGSHLHMDAKGVMPIDENDLSKGYYNLWQNNGWYGCFNFEPFIMEQYAVDLNNALKKLMLQLAQLLSRLEDWLNK